MEDDGGGSSSHHSGDGCTVPLNKEKGEKALRLVERQRVVT